MHVHDVHVPYDGAGGCCQALYCTSFPVRAWQGELTMEGGVPSNSLDSLRL